MGTAKKGGYIEKLLKKADKALQEGVKKADEVLEDAVEIGIMTGKQASKTSKEFRRSRRCCAAIQGRVFPQQGISRTVPPFAHLNIKAKKTR